MLATCDCYRRDGKTHHTDICKATSDLRAQLTEAQTLAAAKQVVEDVNRNYLETLVLITQQKTCDACNAQDYAQHAIDHGKAMLSAAEGGGSDE